MHCKKLVSMSLSSLTVVFVSFLLTMLTTGVSYGLNHSSSITSDETWYAANNPHIVTTVIHVYSSATLTIEKGCEVRFDAGAALYIGYFSAATLNAVGTEDVPITFTSNTGSPAPNDWRGIVFFNSTVDGSTIMDYCTIEYGGQDTYNSNINCNNASPTIQNCTIKDSNGYGIYCDDNSAPTLTNNTISNNGSYPITILSSHLGSNVTGNTGSGNGTDAIEVRGGSITSNRTWVLQGFYFHVTDKVIHVYGDATLTINPGCLVKFDGGTALFIGYYSGAVLNAVGTSGNPITFTSSASTPAPGDWRGIVFFNSTVDGSTIMDYCTVEYGGLDSYNSNINCNDASPTIQNCTIRHSDGYGIYCDNNSAPTLTNNTISDNGSYPISEYCNILDSNVTGNTGSGNVPDAIEVRGGVITSVSSHTWIPQDFYFNVTGNIHVYDGATLTIPPGCLVKFNSGTHFYIGYYSAATLNAVGTSGNPITFTSNESTPAPGDWTGILFFNSTDDASTIMDYCTVEYGGHDSYNSNINCNDASPTIQNCTIRHSDGYGIYCDNNSAPTLTNNTISNNGSYPISEYCNMLDSNVTGNTGSSNGTDAIQVRDGSITSSRTWVPQDLYFKVTSGGTHVYSDAILTINPGCMVKFEAGAALYFGYYSAAALIADGTSGKPITFTSSATTPAPGDWMGIVFFNSTDDSATIMKYCTVEYGGYSSYNSNINCNQASPTIQHCIIRNSDGYGIYTTGSEALPLISCSSLTNNDYGVYSESNSNPTITDCSIDGNTSLGVYNASSSITIDAENNWWGSADGPSGVGSGSGDAVSNYVDFDPWLTAFDSCLATIELSPLFETNIVGSLHTITATVTDESLVPIEGIVIFFYITSGPHAGLNGNDTTDANGEATFTYTGTLDGNDTIEASIVDFFGRTITSNSVTMTWGPVNNPPVAICYDVTVSADANCSANASVDDGSYDPDGDTISLSQSPAGPYPLGETTVTLTVTDNYDASSSCQATVTVVDDTPPVITLNGTDLMTVECHTGFTDPGATASDNCDGTVNVTTSGSVDPNTTGTYTITYSATDGSGNTATETRTVNVVDTTAPVITLTGANPMTVECHTGFTDPGATANDTCDGTMDVNTSGSVDPNTTGTYTITYSATDGSGNTATKTRTVNVEDTASPTITLKPSITYWSPDHKYKTVMVSQMVQGVSDGCDSVGINDVVIEQVTSDEPEDVLGTSDGNTKRDIVIATTCKSVQLRSERDGLKNGRVYVITLRVRDASGNAGRAEFKVTVPLSQNQTPAVQDAVAYTVTSSCL